MEEWIGVRELGRRTERTHKAIQKAIADKRIPDTAVRRSEAGRIRAVEYHSAVQGLRENTDPAEALRNGKDLPGNTGITPGQAQEGARDSGDGKSPEKAGRDPDGYLEARARREQFAAKQAEVDFLKAIGLLVSVDEMRKVGARRYRGMRDKLLGIADREADRLAAERDPVQVHAILTSALKQALHELADDAEAESAGGVAERVAA